MNKETNTDAKASTNNRTPRSAETRKLKVMLANHGDPHQCWRHRLHLKDMNTGG